IVRECRPPAREPGRSWLARRSTTATSTPANANSPANISPVGPPPATTTACLANERRSGEVEAIEVHDLVPCGDEVTHEHLLRVVACVCLREGSELGVRTEDQVDRGGGPLDLARAAIATLVHVLCGSGRRPLRAHVEQVREEVV